MNSAEDGPEGAVPATGVKTPAHHVTVTLPAVTGPVGGAALVGGAAS